MYPTDRSAFAVFYSENIVGDDNMVDEYQKLRKIGSGTFGQVWLVVSRETAKQFVIKEVNVAGLAKQLRAQTLTEVEALGRCRHLNIIRYRDAFVHAGALNIVMEYAEGGRSTHRTAFATRLHKINITAMQLLVIFPVVFL